MRIIEKLTEATEFLKPYHTAKAKAGVVLGSGLGNFVQEIKVQRPKRVKLTAEESLKRMEAFPERKEQIVAAVRKSKNRGPSS